MAVMTCSRSVKLISVHSSSVDGKRHVGMESWCQIWEDNAARLLSDIRSCHLCRASVCFMLLVLLGHWGRFGNEQPHYSVGYGCFSFWVCSVQKKKKNVECVLIDSHIFLLVKWSKSHSPGVNLKFSLCLQFSWLRKSECPLWKRPVHKNQ